MLRLAVVACHALLAFARGPTRPYDRGTTTFSPDGSLHQTAYASAAAIRGSLAVAVSNGGDALAICVSKPPGSALKLDGETTDAGGKIFFVDERVAIVFAGLAADGRAIANSVRLECQRHRLIAGTPASVAHVAGYVAQLQHECTRTGSRRLYGVESIVVGFEFGGFGHRARVPRIFVTGPAGELQEWSAASIGAGAGRARETMEAECSMLNRMDAHKLVRLAARSVLAAKPNPAPATTTEVVLLDSRGRRSRCAATLVDGELMIRELQLDGARVPDG